MDASKYISIIIALLIGLPLHAAIVYVDKSLEADITDGSYAGSPGNGNAYNTLKDVLWGTDGSNPAASAGDTIYLRAGTYDEAWGISYGSDGYGAAMQVSQELSGTNWDNATTIASYPGEWAVIDGTSSAGTYSYSLGNGQVGTWNSGLGHIEYIIFERLGITGGSKCGLGIVLGPVKVRYCHIYGNGAGSVGDSNRGGIVFRRGKENIIEYNYFYDNGDDTSGHNEAHINNYTDYLYNDFASSGNIDECDHSNIIRYNYFGASTRVGYKDKAAQFLGYHNYAAGRGEITSMTYQDKGNQIHHNYINVSSNGVFSQQDFAQIHNNICESCGIMSPNDGGEPPVYYQCIYNNTVKNKNIFPSIGPDRNEQESNFLDLCLLAVGNIVSDFGTSYDDGPSISIATKWDQMDSGDYTWTNTIVDKNLVYNAEDNRHYGLPASHSYQSTLWIGTTAFNAARSRTNYESSTEGLFGVDGFTTNGSFVIGSTTIANGGYNAAHPYLSGVTIPAYVGAVNPSDSDWVAGVLGLATDSNSDSIPDNLLAATAGSDPSWIEGSGSSPSTPTITSGSFRRGGIR